jgi:hypothetical protein
VLTLFWSVMLAMSAHRLRVAGDGVVDDRPADGAAVRPARLGGRREAGLAGVVGGLAVGGVEDVLAVVVRLPVLPGHLAASAPGAAVRVGAGRQVCHRQALLALKLHVVFLLF